MHHGIQLRSGWYVITMGEQKVIYPIKIPTRPTIAGAMAYAQGVGFRRIEQCRAKGDARIDIKIGRSLEGHWLIGLGMRNFQAGGMKEHARSWRPAIKRVTKNWKIMVGGMNSNLVRLAGQRLGAYPLKTESRALLTEAGREPRYRLSVLG